MKTILVLTDFSVRADHAACYALKLAQKIKADLLLCNIYPGLPVEPMSFQVARPIGKYEAYAAESANELNNLAGRLSKMSDSNTVEGGFRPAIKQCSKAGPLGDNINAITSGHNVLMAVISMHSPDVSPVFLLADHANEIIEKANCPVLVVPYQASFNGFKKISFATDLTHSGMDILHALYGLTKYFDSEILITHVSDQNSLDMEEQQVINQFFDQGSSLINYPKMRYRAIKSKNVANGLDWLSEHTDIDLLVLVHRKRNFFQKIFDGGITQKLANHLTKPMLVLPSSKVQQALPVF